MSVALNPFSLQVAPLEDRKQQHPVTFAASLFDRWAARMHETAWGDDTVERSFRGYCMWLRNGTHAEEAFEVQGSCVTLKWPPSGIALAALLLRGRRLWPAFGHLVRRRASRRAGYVGPKTGGPFAAGVALTVITLTRLRLAVR